MKRLIIVGMLVLGLSGVVLYLLRENEDRRSLPPWPNTSFDPHETSVHLIDGSVLGDRRGANRGHPRLNLALHALRAASGPNATDRILTELHRYLSELPSDQAAEMLTEYLRDVAQDAETGIEFSIGKGGSLAGHPSFRVALLDWLGEIDPQQAGHVAEEILLTPTDPDEWAVSLRNYGRVHPDQEGRDFLRMKTEELIGNPAWRENPSVGFLESFDVLVHTRATESSSLLSELVADRSEEGRVLAHASYLTLDRLAMREPATMMRQLAAQPELSKSRGKMVANMFARADLRDSEQRELVRDYLLNPARTPVELTAFAGVYPNANQALSNNLLTETETAGGADLASHDRAALQIVESWIGDPAFESRRRPLQTMHDRLTAFLRQASK